MDISHITFSAIISLLRQTVFNAFAHKDWPGCCTAGGLVVHHKCPAGPVADVWVGHHTRLCRLSLCRRHNAVQLEWEQPPAHSSTRTEQTHLLFQISGIVSIMVQPVTAWRTERQNVSEKIKLQNLFHMTCKEHAFVTCHTKEEECIVLTLNEPRLKVVSSHNIGRTQNPPQLITTEQGSSHSCCGNQADLLCSCLNCELYGLGAE